MKRLLKERELKSSFPENYGTAAVRALPIPDSRSCMPIDLDAAIN